ncbi:ABC transporter ATP-binding protein [Proteiniborus sp.]|uniref:ABC transporter ATP-binding protein n=1 Tax=Proteiniborus sp. TaxID=2079015 RepID=UPI00331AE0FA
MIQINNVTKKFDDFIAVNNVSLNIDDGDFIGLLGPNGAGKTTIIKMLTGLLKPTCGDIYINGQKMTRNNKDVKKILGIVPQYTNLDKELTAYENLVFAAKLFRVKDYKKKIFELLEFMELEGYKDRKAMNLSGGMARRLMIAKALINDPEIIFLDEPTVGIDLNGRRKIWDILKAMKAMGKTILLTTHYIEEADYLCNKVCLIDKGKIIDKDTPDNLKKDLGAYTMEYFDNEMKTKYKFFKNKEEVIKYTTEIMSSNYTLRETTLEDVFYNFTNRKVI